MESDEVGRSTENRGSTEGSTGGGDRSASAQRFQEELRDLHRWRLNRRRFLQLGAAATGAGLASNPLWPSGALASTLRVPSGALTGPTANERDPQAAGATAVTTSTTTSSNQLVVPKPTGVASTDTANALTALNVPAGTTVIFQSSASAVYTINKELPVPPGVRVTGRGAAGEQPKTGLMPTLRQAPGTSLKCIMASAGYLAGLYNTAQYNNGVQQHTADSAIEVDHLVFDGNNGGSAGGGNTLGHGLVLYSIGSFVHDCYFVNTAQASLVVSDANYAGAACVDQQVENRIYDNKTMNSGWQGILVTKTSGAPGCTDGLMFSNVIESPSLQTDLNSPNLNPSTGLPYEAIRMENAAGWWVENNHAYACTGNGMYFSTPWGMHLVYNSTDSFGATPVPGKTYVGYEIDISGAATQSRPILVTGNQLSAYEGYNTASPVAPGVSNTYEYFRIVMSEASWNNTAWLVQSDNACHEDSQPPAPISGATVTGGSTTVLVPHGSTIKAVQAGMSIADSRGFIPAGTTIVSVVQGSGTSPDSITMSASATGTSTADTVSFPAPSSIGWTYINNLSGSTLLVNRTNEIVSSQIDPTPAISGVGTVTLVDPADYAGGIPVSGTPSPNQVLTATSSSTAAWATLASGSSGPRVTVITSSGSYSIPSGATQLRVTCVGGGGGGGGGGSATSAIAQAGGSGGAAGATSTQVVSVGSNSSLAVTVGSGGAGGSGGAAGGNNAGQNGASGADTTVSGSGILVRGGGGPGGKGAAGASTSNVNGAAYGGQSGDFVAGATAGCGGESSLAGGAPTESSGGGGGGGGQSNVSSGGGGGGAGDGATGGSAGAKASASTSSGAGGGSATSAGAGGGGGGGGTSGGAGGPGGSGASGFAIVEILG